MLVSEDGASSIVHVAQRDARRVLEDEGVTLVGAIDELNVFAVAKQNRSHLSVNVVCSDAARFHDLPLRGPILFVATDDRGEEVDVDIVKLKTVLQVQ